MPDTDRKQDFLTRRNRTPVEHLAAFLLIPFTILYRLALLFRKALYKMGIFKSHRLPERVISIGGITVGGSGKTPVLIHIAGMLEERGRNVLILTRGYGGAESSNAVITPGENILNSRFSDEVRLMVSSLNSTLGVGSDRVRSHTMANEDADFDFCLLDDGFQHWKIKRDIDIVVLDATAPFGNGLSLPRGSLREPRYSLGRADAVIVTRANQTDDLKRSINEIRNVTRSIPVIVSEYRVDGVIDVKTGRNIEMEELIGRVFRAFTAVANPGSFYRTAEEIGLSIKSRRSFRDHHIFTQYDADELAKEARAEQCDAFIVTEKDSVKLKTLDFSSIPVYAIRISLHILEGEDSLCDLVFGNR